MINSYRIRSSIQFIQIVVVRIKHLSILMSFYATIDILF
nr:MAG TPA: hypothetical protein [Caudoviricetes sp.]